MKKILFLLIMLTGILAAQNISKECRNYVDDALRVGENVEAYQNQYNIKMRTTEEFIGELKLSLYVLNEDVARDKCKSKSKNVENFINNVVKTRNSIEENIKRLEGN